MTKTNLILSGVYFDFEGKIWVKITIYHMNRPYIKPFHKFSNKRHVT